MPKTETAKLKGDIKALTESIAHWRRMKADRECGDSPRAEECALWCLYESHGVFACHYCPITEDAGHGECGRTPFYAARNALYGTNETRWQKAAQDEIDYLVRLRRKFQARLKRLGD